MLIVLSSRPIAIAKVHSDHSLTVTGTHMSYAINGITQFYLSSDKGDILASQKYFVTNTIITIYHFYYYHPVRSLVLV